ncbi:cupin domain-containing protein [Actinocrinis sp.]|jgi:mannose-6-phosphate isomerase-like protein (cupin superfamily)|uniref:cupin domain-containing protein n=1 Tax=Actinocrinis sp. TaxID=1920516 RepID=UPI002D6DADA8|nr:cupin domain-containing protein [Actinocrinis sp.]HZP49581.1 cupin domain-containing protein [Actinocrinis sp.]
MTDVLVAHKPELLARVDPGPRDIAALTDAVRAGKRIGNENLHEDDHLNELIPKPWGFEYRVFADDFLDVWHLSIGPGHGTSTHVHPRKVTYLLCLAGEGVMNTLSGELPVSQGTAVRIGAGAFHGTRSTGTEPLHLVEVEAPRNKFDLIRLRDGYNREREGYESKHAKLNDTAPSRPVPYLPSARLRTGCPDGRFRFEIRAGMDIFYRRREQDLFHIPLGVSGVVAGELQILAARREDPRRPAVDQYYLSLAEG